MTTETNIQTSGVVITGVSPNVEVATKLTRIPPMDAYIAADGHVTGDIGLRCEPNCISIYRSIDRTVDRFSITAAGASGERCNAITPWQALVTLLRLVEITTIDDGEGKPSFKYTGGEADKYHWYFLPGLNGQVLANTPVLGGNSHDAREFLSQCYSEIPWDTNYDARSKRYAVKLPDGKWYAKTDEFDFPVFVDTLEEARLFSLRESSEMNAVVAAHPGSLLYLTTVTVPDPKPFP